MLKHTSGVSDGFLATGSPLHTPNLFPQKSAHCPVTSVLNCSVITPWNRLLKICFIANSFKTLPRVHPEDRVKIVSRYINGKQTYILDNW